MGGEIVANRDSIIFLDGSVAEQGTALKYSVFCSRAPRIKIFSFLNMMYANVRACLSLGQ